MEKDPITDYSKTQRIVLLIDLNPLRSLHDPTPYFTILLSSIKTLLSFPPLSSSLFSFKPFFSSLSPLLSSSKLSHFHFSSTLSFDLPDPTFLSLSRFLNSLKETSITFTQNFPETTSSKGFHVAASMRQLVHDYGWEPVFCDPVIGTVLDFVDFGFVRSNLVVLFSPISRDLNSLSEFFNVGGADEADETLFELKFSEVFEGVNDAFVSRNIHFSWVDVKCEIGSHEIDEAGLDSRIFENRIRDLGWGFCSTDSIILGSALIPFGLIYPRIAISPHCLTFNDSCKRVPVHLSLDILDVNGKPLECKCAELVLVDSKILSTNTDELFVNSKAGNGPKKRAIVDNLRDEITNLKVKAVRCYTHFAKMAVKLSNPVIVCDLFGESCSDKRAKCREGYADRVFDMLRMEMNESMARKPVPIWQILLSYLYREDYWALVSVSDGNGSLCMGILKPFTIYSAFLYIVEDGLSLQNMVEGLGGVNSTPLMTNTNNEISKSLSGWKPSSHIVNPKSAPSLDDKHEKRKTHKKNLNLLKDPTWSSFCRGALDHSGIDLEQVYFARGCSNSKKLKFLKCWMKQIKKSSTCCLELPMNSKPQEDFSKETHEKVNDLCQESEKQIALSTSVVEKQEIEICTTQEKVASDFRSETLESFLDNLPNKIQQGLESEGVDMGALAERLVSSSIFWLYQKVVRGNNSASELREPKSACGNSVATELKKLLLKDIKDFAGMHKKVDLSLKASDVGFTESASEVVVREYELQILFRMEILKSEVGRSIEQPMKQKFVKQICLLLEAIQCQLQKGFFGDWSLDDYIGRTIKTRYNHILGDVVHSIYAEMDLLLLSDDELSGTIPSSEDVHHSDKQKRAREDVRDDRVDEQDSAEDESFPLEEHLSRKGITREEHANRLSEARKSRERARRVSSFTSWMPDLQRVWVPKKVKVKKQRRRHYDMVCKTPTTESKCSWSPENDRDYDHVSHSSGSIPRALFQE